jgi:replicative DNA helicase
VAPSLSATSPRAPVTDGLPPHSREAEVAVLGSMLVEKESLLKAFDMLREEDFYEENHRRIFTAVRSLHDRNVTADVVTVGDELDKAGRLAGLGGRAALFELTNLVPSALHVEHYARIVREKSILRQMIAIARTVVDESRTSTDEAQSLLDSAQQRFFVLSQDRAARGMVSASALMQSAITTLEKMAESSKYVTGVSTGFSEWDKMTSGLQPANLIIIAGRPSMGKTAFCLNVAEHVAIKSKRPVVFFSLEMSEQEIGLRLLCSQARINVRSVREGFLSRKSWPTITNVASEIASAPLYFDFSTSPSILDIRGSARRWAHELKQKGTPLSLIIIDYIQLLHGGSRMESRQQEISEISRSIKGLARELQVPVIALSQLNRRPEDKGREGRPQLSDLRECVTGDTRVALADGRHVCIQSLVGQRPRVVSVSPQGKVVMAVAEKVWKVGRRSVLRFQTASGRSIHVTADHRLLTFDGWRRAAHIPVGERLAVPRHLPAPLRPDKWMDERVILLAHLMGDGSYLVHQPLRYTTSSQENSEAVVSSVNKAFGTPVKRYKGRGCWHQLLISGNGNRWKPAGVGGWLKELGIFGQRSHEKRVPGPLFTLDNRQIGLFVRHLWATDGTISLRAFGRGGANVSYATNSDGLAQDVAGLLLRLGIVARISKVKQGRYRPLYHVRVSGGENMKAFLNRVGAFGPRVEPAGRLENLLAAQKSATNVDTLPRKVFDQVKSLMREKGISHRQMAALRGTSYGGNAHFCFGPSRSVLAQYAGILEDRDLLSQAQSDLFWDPVVSIDPAGEEDVFDLTVPGSSSWIGNGIVSHNSGALEQDADVVAAIFREEVYKRDDPDVKGKAKLFVLKQRNGPIGDIDLNFISEFTKFADPAPEGDNF